MTNPKLAQFIGAQAAIRRVADEMAVGDPADVQTRAALARAYSSVGDQAAAVRHLLVAVKLEPGHAGLAYDLGVGQQYIGDFPAAAASFRRAIALAPGFYRPYVSLVMLEKQTPADNFLPALKGLFSGPDPQGLVSLHVGHALAKTYEDLGDLPASFAWLEKAKKARGRISPYDRVAEDRLFKAAADLHGPSSGASSGYPSGEPIFVVGLPRTGTTLVDRILSSHPDVLSAGELSHLFKLLMMMSGSGQVDVATLKSAQAFDMADFGRAYIDSTRPLTGKTPRFTDKAPINVLLAGLILRALPNARIVCLRRNPMDSILGNYRQMFATPSQQYNYAFSLEDTARHYILFDRLAAHWRKVLPADRYMEVGYEDLVTDQEAQTRRLLEFANLSWDDRCLAFHENPNAVSTPSSMQVRSPVYKTAIGRWRTYGDLLKPARDVLAAARVPVD